MNKPKIDILMPTGYRGGVENVVNLIATELIDRGYDIRVVQIIYTDLSWINEKVPHVGLIEGLGQYDLNDLVTLYAEFLNKNGMPHKIIATNWPICVYIAKMALALVGESIPVIAWPHTVIEEYIRANVGGYEYLGLADRCLAISEYIKKEIQTVLPDLDIVRVNNAIEINGTHNNNQERSENTLLFVGRVDPVKRIEIIIEAMAKAEDKWKLIIVGDAENKNYKEMLIKLAKERGVNDRIDWRGWQRNPWHNLPNIRFFCMPSHHEGFPLGAIEALGNGIPVIATPVSGIVEMIIPGVNGFIIAHEGVDEFVEVLNLSSRKMLKCIQAEACKKVMTKYSVENATDVFERALV